MTSMTALTDSVALLLFRNLRDGIEDGTIADLASAQIEVGAAMAELNSRRPSGEQTHIHDLIGQLVLEIGSLHEKVSKCEEQLAGFQLQANILKEDTTQIVARTEACGLLVEQQQKENAKVLAAMEAIKTSTPPASPPYVATTAPSLDPHARHAPSRAAVVSFPGGPRTVTIHPPDSPSYQSIIYDEKGNVIIDFRRTKPLRREGAFRGPLEDIDWCEITRVRGRGPEKLGRRPTPPSPRWPDRSQPSSHVPSRTPRQRRLSASPHTDAFGRVLPPERSTDTSASLASLQDPESRLGGMRESVLSPSPVPATPPSPSAGRGRKRARRSEDEEDAPATAGACEEVPLSAHVRAARKSATRDGATRPLEGPEKRRKLRSSASEEGLSAVDGSLSRTRSSLDVTRTV